jgi:outer membrane biosynthesis protein TonB
LNSEPDIQNPGNPRKKLAIGGGVLLLAVVAVIVFFPKGRSSSRESSSITMVNLPPVLTLPPPPPPQTEQQKLDDKKDEAQVIDPNNAPNSADDDLAKAESDSNDGFGIRGSKTGKGFGTGGSWGWYTSQLQSAIQDALRQNPKTRHAGLRIMIRVWPDPSGILSRVELMGSTGDPSLDEAIKTQVLGGLRLRPPPEDMPRPVTLRITGRPPS